jgi:hypothetical protein
MSEFVSIQEERAYSYLAGKYPVDEPDVAEAIAIAKAHETPRLSGASYLMNEVNFEAERNGIKNVPAMLAAVTYLESGTPEDKKQLTLSRRLEILTTGELTSAQKKVNRLAHTTNSIALQHFLEVLK